MDRAKNSMAAEKALQDLATKQCDLYTTNGLPCEHMMNGEKAIDVCRAIVKDASYISKSREDGERRMYVKESVVKKALRVVDQLAEDKITDATK